MNRLFKRKDARGKGRTEVKGNPVNVIPEEDDERGEGREEQMIKITRSVAVAKEFKIVDTKNGDVVKEGGREGGVGVGDAGYTEGEREKTTSGGPFVFGCFDVNGKCGLKVWRERWVL